MGEARQRRGGRRGVRKNHLVVRFCRSPKKRVENKKCTPEVHRAPSGPTVRKGEAGCRGFAVAERRSAVAATARARAGRSEPALRPCHRAFRASPRLARAPRSFAAPPSDGSHVRFPSQDKSAVSKRFCRTFVLTPLQHLLDDAEAQRVIVDDENPQAGGEAGVCNVGRHLARLARSARQTLAERGKAT